MLTDAHCHLENNSDLAKLQVSDNIKAIINCQTPEKWKINKSLTNQQPLSFGIHPWDVNKYDFQSALPCLNQADVVGEIGLDSVWTDNDLQTQTEVFNAQVRWAQENHKPVILHTKGCEAAILKTIRHYSNRYLIHWYDCSDYQQEYIDQDCYFSICLALLFDPSVRQLAQLVPLDRLLVETDGLSSVGWLLKKPVATTDYPFILKKTFAALAQLRQVEVDVLTKQVNKNWSHFLK